MQTVKVNVFEPQKNPDGSPFKMLGSQILLFIETIFVHKEGTTILEEFPEEVSSETKEVYIRYRE
jgi:hypothetical protein